METAFDIGRLLTLRKLTRSVADLLGGELKGYLNTLAPLLHPRQVFGEYVRSAIKQSSKGEHEAYEQLRGLYASLANAAPYNLRKEIELPLELPSVQPELAPAEYTREIRGSRETKLVEVASPLRWSLSYAGSSPKRLRELLANQKTITGNEIQQCLLQHLLLHVTLARRPGIGEILAGLRFRVVSGQAEGLGDLPITFLEAPLGTFLPDADVIIQSTEISGAAVFEEVVNPDDFAALADPLRERLSALRSAAGLG